MEFKLIREEQNHLYTEGQLLVNGLCLTQTVEATARILPPGQYLVRLTKDKQRRRIIGIWIERGEGMRPFFTGRSIGMGHSWKNSRENRTVCIGRLLIPGAVFRARDTYERLFERIKKCQQRKEPIRLCITAHRCRPGEPLRHWEQAQPATAQPEWKQPLKNQNS